MLKHAPRLMLAGSIIVVIAAANGFFGVPKSIVTAGLAALFVGIAIVATFERE